MNDQINISDIFPKHHFWDMNPNHLDLLRDKDIIIPRALYFTTPDTFSDDITKLELYYSSTQIVKELTSTTELISNEVCLLIAKRYNIPIFSRFHK